VPWLSSSLNNIEKLYISYAPYFILIYTNIQEEIVAQLNKKRYNNSVRDNKEE
jgi:hypothetical protein